MKLYIFFSVLVYSCIVNAQQKQSIKDTLKVKASANISGFWQSGNVDTFIFNAKSKTDVDLSKSTHFFNKNAYTYMEFGKNKAASNILSLNFLSFRTTKKVQPILLSFISTNYQRDIDVRYLLGGGVSSKLVQTKSFKLISSLTSEYENTNFEQANFNYTDYNDSRRFQTWRSTLWLQTSLKLLDNKIKLNTESYFQPSLLDTKNYRWKTNFDIQFPIYNFLSFSVNYTYTFESVIIATQKQQDQFLTFGLNFKNYN